MKKSSYDTYIRDAHIEALPIRHVYNCVSIWWPVYTLSLSRCEVTLQNPKALRVESWSSKNVVAWKTRSKGSTICSKSAPLFHLNLELEIIELVVDLEYPVGWTKLEWCIQNSRMKASRLTEPKCWRYFSLCQASPQRVANTGTSKYFFS